VGELHGDTRGGCRRYTTGPLAIGYVFSAKASLDTVLYAGAAPSLLMRVLTFLRGRIFRRQFRMPVVATAGE
jgi:hypothetical protein